MVDSGTKSKEIYFSTVLKFLFIFSLYSKKEKENISAKFSKKEKNI